MFLEKKISEHYSFIMKQNSKNHWEKSSLTIVNAHSSITENFLQWFINQLVFNTLEYRNSSD